MKFIALAWILSGKNGFQQVCATARRPFIYKDTVRLASGNAHNRSV